MPPRETPIENFIGKKYGRLIVSDFCGYGRSGGNKIRIMLCKCDCGKEKKIRLHDLVRNTHPTRSCGCLVLESGTCFKFVHGKYLTPENRSWHAMKSRCEGKYKRERYGLRGIRVCKRWRESFLDFLSDMGKKPTRSHSIDRFPNRDGNYSCGRCDECLENKWLFNCRWATIKQQNNNRGSSKRERRVTYNGATLPITQWAKKINIKRSTLYARLFYEGWDVERAFTQTPKINPEKRK